MDEPKDTGDLLEVPEDERLDKDPNPRKDQAHAALGDGGADDVSDVEEGEVVEDDFDDAADEGTDEGTDEQADGGEDS
jgi:hypothetical protein